jgi:hypothetical protein
MQTSFPRRADVDEAMTPAFRVKETRFSDKNAPSDFFKSTRLSCCARVIGRRAEREDEESYWRVAWRGNNRPITLIPRPRARDGALSCGILSAVFEYGLAKSGKEAGAGFFWASDMDCRTIHGKGTTREGISQLLDR